MKNGSISENGSGKMNHFTPEVFRSLKQLGINTIWYTGIIEMATKSDFSSLGIAPDNPHVVKGNAGSPYAIKDYYDVDPSIAEDAGRRREEFRNLVKRTHQAGLRCIIDFVPNHTARHYHSDCAPDGVSDFGKGDDITKCFSTANDYYYITDQKFSPSVDIDSGGNPYVEFPAKATGNDCFSAFPGKNDWYETVKLNYGVDYGDGTRHFTPVPPVWKKMADILLHWASTGIDGFRCDMVFMVPVEFWNWVIPIVKSRYPDLIFIGEIYDIAQYHRFIDYGHFDYLYDKVGLYDTLKGIRRDNVSAAKITGCWQAVDGIGDKMLNFLENHDEVRFGSDEYAGNPSAVIPYLTVCTMISKGPVLIYYGQEIGESGHDEEGFSGLDGKSTIFDYWSYDTLRRWYCSGKCDSSMLTSQEQWLRSAYSRILNLCNDESAIREGGFFDLMYANLRNPDFDPHSLFAFVRHTEESKLLIVANFSDTGKHVRISFPDEALSCTGIERREYTTRDLLTGQTVNLDFSGSSAAVSVAAGNARILKLDQNTKPFNKP